MNTIQYIEKRIKEIEQAIHYTEENNLDCLYMKHIGEKIAMEEILFKISLLPIGNTYILAIGNK